MSNPYGGGGGYPPNSGGFGQPPSGGGAFGPPQGGGGAFGPPQGGGFGPPQGGGFGPPPGPPGVQINEMPAMIMGIVTALFCCMPGGVIGLLLAQQAKTAATKGDQAGAESKLRLSMMVSGGSIVLTICGICLIMAFQVLLGSQGY
jgi:hypothetical protein